MIKRVVILGHTGFVGRSIYQEFKNIDKFDIMGLSTQQCDLGSLEITRQVLSQLQKDDVVIMAAVVLRTKDNSFSAMTKNIAMAENLSQALKARPVQQLIFLSTIDVFGCEKLEGSVKKISETSNFHPDDYYSLGKLTSEFLLDQRCRELRIPFTILRFPGIYGLEDNFRSLIGKLVHDANVSGQINVNGLGDQIRNYVSTKDLFNIVLESLEQNIVGDYNVVSAQSYSILDVAKIIAHKIKGAKINHIYDAPKSRTLDLIFDDLKFRQTFTKSNFMSLEEGIEKYIKSAFAHNR